MTQGVNRRIMLCSCRKSMKLDEKRLRKALGGLGEVSFHDALCRDDIHAARTALKHDGALLIACTQEAPLFAELAEEAGRTAPLEFVNIRETAGWSAQGGKAAPKMAALIAAATIPQEPAPLMDVTSRGRCLIAAPAQQALELAAAISGDLSVSVLVTGGEEDVLPPARHAFAIRKGSLAALSGHFGAFRARIKSPAPMLPWGRPGLVFGAPGEDVEEEYDVVIEISDMPARFAHGREGWFHAAPDDTAGLARIIARAAPLSGAFETIIHARCKTSLCAHARNAVQGCSRCLDACPSAAIAPRGEAVFVDPVICEGCGDCAAVCPSGAMDYLTPARNGLIARGNAMLRAFFAAAGSAPVILFHEARHGGELLRALAHFADGLPASVIPLGVHSIGVISHEIMAAFMAAGAARIALLAPRAKAAGLAATEEQMALLKAFLGGLGYTDHDPRLLATDDPFEVSEWLAHLEAPSLKPSAISPMGSKRDIARMSLEKLHAGAPAPVDILELPAGAPYGRVLVDKAACTLCLSCVSTCPAGALSDNPDRPQLRFSEISCLQCGLCRKVCPEGAISLAPRYDFTPRAAERITLAEDEPMTCPACGKPFGSRHAIERVIEKLVETANPMFADESQRELLRYCEDCRVIAISMNKDDPFAATAPPGPRTTEDYAKDE